MIVKDEATKQAAIELIRKSNQVFYSDRNLYSAVVKSPEMLDFYIQRTFNREEIAIVGTELQSMELFDYELKQYKEQKRRQEIKDAREWFKTHPKEVARVVRRAELREEQANA